MTAQTVDFGLIKPDKVVELAERHGWTPTTAEAAAVAFYATLWLEDARLPDEKDEQIVEAMVASGPIPARLMLLMEYDRAIMPDTYPSCPAEDGIIGQAIDIALERLGPVVKARQPYLWKHVFGND